MQTTATPFPIAEPGPQTLASEQDVTLIGIHDRTLDSVRGFAKMVETADPMFHDVAERFHSLHAHHAERLVKLLTQRGIGADAGGAAIGPVSETAAAFRTFFDDIDEDVMDQVRSGENWVLKSFDDAIKAQGEDSLAAALREMRDEVVSLLADTTDFG